MGARPAPDLRQDASGGPPAAPAPPGARPGAAGLRLGAADPPAHTAQPPEGRRGPRDTAVTWPLQRHGRPHPESREALCFAGVCPRNLHISFSRAAGHPLDLTCELYGWDWDLYQDAGAELALSPLHQVFDPLNRGLADKLRALFREGAEEPAVRHCPFARRSFIFGPGGKVAPCPVAHGRLQADTARYAPLLADLYGSPCPPVAAVLAQEVAIARERRR